MDPFCGSKFRVLKDAVTAKSKPFPRIQKIYVARLDSQARRLVNEHELVSNLKELGFFIFNASEHTYETQLALFRDCSIIVGAHGAGLTNLAFAAESCTVIELFSHGWQQSYFYQMSKVIGKRYVPFISKGKCEMDGWRVSQWILNVPEFVVCRCWHNSL
jgi:capsular polysaccharide biosynthesis protein